MDRDVNCYRDRDCGLIRFSSVVKHSTVGNVRGRRLLNLNPKIPKRKVVSVAGDQTLNPKPDTLNTVW